MLSTTEQNLLCKALVNLKSINSLTLPTVANTAILEVIATNLKLKILDLSCSTNVTDYSLMHLIGNQSLCNDTLQQLFLDGTSVTTNGIMVLLGNLPLEILESPSLERALGNLFKVFVKKFTSENNFKIILCHY